MFKIIKIINLIFIILLSSCSIRRCKDCGIVTKVRKSSYLEPTTTPKYIITLSYIDGMDNMLIFETDTLYQIGDTIYLSKHK